MSFQPFVSGGGLVGWRLLQRTQAAQMAAFSDGPELKRETDKFLARIGEIKSAQDLVSDRQLLKVALGAFGLQDDLNNLFFIRKILEDGTSAQDALSNRLADKRYRTFSDAFGFGPGASRRTGDAQQMAEIARKYQAQEFEAAVGQTDETMRLALFAQHELRDIAVGSGSETTKWLNVIGSPPLRKIFQTALGLPQNMAAIDLDKQVEMFRDRLEQRTGQAEIGQFSDPETLKSFTEQYIARAQIAAAGPQHSSAAIALTLLRG